jgi:hypothetical protein
MKYGEYICQISLLLTNSISPFVNEESRDVHSGATLTQSWNRSGPAGSKNVSDHLPLVKESGSKKKLVFVFFAQVFVSIDYCNK